MAVVEQARPPWAAKYELRGLAHADKGVRHHKVPGLDMPVYVVEGEASSEDSSG
ncbi:hypothetical protein D3C76_1534970 [compost metagenome]